MILDLAKMIFITVLLFITMISAGRQQVFGRIWGSNEFNNLEHNATSSEQQWMISDADPLATEKYVKPTEFDEENSSKILEPEERHYLQVTPDYVQEKVEHLEKQGMTTHTKIEVTTAYPEDVEASVQKEASEVPEVADTTSVNFTDDTEMEYPQLAHARCSCDSKRIWIDMVFVIDASRAVSHQDFIAIANLLAFYARQMQISQDSGPYARVGIIIAAEEAYTVANLTAFSDGEDAANKIREMLRRKSLLPVGSGLRFNVAAALTQAQMMIHSQGRVGKPTAVILFSAHQVTCARYLNRTWQQMRYEKGDPCRIGARLTGGNNVLITVAMKFGALTAFPRIDIGTPCFHVVNDINLPYQLLSKICDANCFCPHPYEQYKEKHNCVRHAECIYNHGIALSREVAEETCSMNGGTLVNIFDKGKEQFIKKLHEENGNTPYWIGLKKVDGRYVWATGAELKDWHYSNWRYGKPLGNADCIAANTFSINSTRWYEENCEGFNTRYFSCQRRACDTHNYCSADENGEYDKWIYFS